MPHHSSLLLSLLLLAVSGMFALTASAEMAGPNGPVGATFPSENPDAVLRRLDPSDPVVAKARASASAVNDGSRRAHRANLERAAEAATGYADSPIPSLNGTTLRKFGPALQSAVRRLGAGDDRQSGGPTDGASDADAEPAAPWPSTPPMDLDGWTPDYGDSDRHDRPLPDLSGGPDRPVRVLVTADDDEALRGVGMTIRGRVGSVVAGTVPLARLGELARLDTVHRIDWPVTRHALNDEGRPDIRAPQAIAVGGTSGQGALVGVIDSGIDFTHPAMRNADGTTRIAGLLDMSFPGDYNADGELDGPVGGGTAYTRAQIDEALSNGNGSSWRFASPPQSIEAESFLTTEIWMRDRTPVEALTIHLDILHPQISELDITIEDADGNYYEPDALKEAQQSHAFTTYTVPVELGESAAGRWYLHIDNLTNDSGILRSWALFVNRKVHQEDLDGHGTHVAGTAAGSGDGASAIGPLVGVAPEVDLLIVRGQRSESGFDTDDTLVALDWIDGRAQELDRPYVTNMSLGGHYLSAHDGTSPIETAIDGLVGSDKPGKAVVVAAGNEGDEYIHSGGQIHRGNPTIPFWIEATEGEDGVAWTWADIWTEASGTTSPRLIHPYSNDFTCFTGTIEDGQLLDAREDCNAMTRLVPGSELDVVLFDDEGVVNIIWFVWEEGPTADLLMVEWYDSERWWVLSGEWGLGFPGYEGRWDSWSSAGPACRPLAFCNNTSSVASPGTARNALTVGAHVTRTSWRNDLGQEHTLDETLHDLASFSSRGPTRDGRIKPDLTAPGAAILSARASTQWMCPYTDTRFCVEPEASERVRVDDLTSQSNGTSMAAPMVSGAVGLLLASDDSLDAAQIGDLLRDGARQDAYTGRPPRLYDWGAGKLDLANVFASRDLPTPQAPPPSTPTPEVGERLVVRTGGLTFTAIQDLVFDGPATGTGTERQPIELPERITGAQPVIRIDGMETIENQAGYAPNVDESLDWQLPSVWLRMGIENQAGEACVHYDHELQLQLGTPSGEDDGISFAQGDPWLRPFRADRFDTVIEETEARDFVNFTTGELPDGERGRFELVTSMSWYGAAPGYDGIYLVQTCNRAVPTPVSTSPAPPTPVPPSARKYQAFLPIAVSGQQCPPEDVFTDIALVIDASTTMLETDPTGRTKHELSVDAARAFVDGLRLRERGPSDQVALVAFNATSTVLEPLTPIRSALHTALDEFTPIRMQSRVELGIFTGLAQLVGGRHRQANRQVMVVISDGRANPVPGEEAVQAAVAAQEAGIDVMVLGIGPTMDEQTLRAMVSRPTDFYRAPTAAALGGILQELASRTIPCDERMFWPYR